MAPDRSIYDRFCFHARALLIDFKWSVISTIIHETINFINYQTAILLKIHTKCVSYETKQNFCSLNFLFYSSIKSLYWYAHSLHMPSACYQASTSLHFDKHENRRKEKETKSNLLTDLFDKIFSNFYKNPKIFPFKCENEVRTNFEDEGLQKHHSFSSA